VQTVSAGIGITLLPRMALGVEDRPERELNFIPFPAPSPGRTISLAWRRSSSREAEFRLLAERFLQGVPKADRRLPASPA